MRLLILSFIFTCSSYSQQEIHRQKVTTYMPISMYKTKYKKPLTQKDSLNFKFKDKDTLVLVENYKRPEGVRVPYEYKDSTFLNYYKKVAFNHSNGKYSKDTKMKYWKDDIKLFFSKSISKKERKELMSFVNTISSQIDSLNIHQVKHVEDSNFVIYYNGDYDYESKLVDIKTSDYLYWNGKNQLYRAAIKIDPNKYFNSKLRLYKLKEYFFSSIGYFKRINDFNCDSYFSNCYSSNKNLSELDIELLKYHYSYGICKGTSLEMFEEQHKVAKEVLKKNNHKINFIHKD